MRICDAVDEHPKFDELVTLIRSLGHIPNVDFEPDEAKYFNLSFEIAVKLIEKFLDENGNPKVQP